MPSPTGEELAELGKATRWQPGQSGNPKGRLVSDAVDAVLAEEGLPRRLVDAMIAKILREADVGAFKEITERHEGKVGNKLEHSGSVTLTRVVLDELP